MRMQISSLGKASQKYKTAGLGVKGFDFRVMAQFEIQTEPLPISAGKRRPE
jgi:hypothetical protein